MTLLLAAILFALPASAPAVRLLLALHIGAGATALLAGLLPMLGRKGGRWHVGAGRVYTVCMVAVAATATALCALQPLTTSRLLLTGIAVLSFYLSFTGWRAARRHSTQLPRPDQLLAATALLVGLLMLGAGLRLQAVLFAFFGGLLVLFAGLDVRQALRPPASATPWLLRHFTRLGGSYIATFTAFVVVNLGRWLPADAPAWAGLAGWLAPTFLGTFLIFRTVRRYRAGWQPAARGSRSAQTAGPLVKLALLLLLAAPAALAQGPARLTGTITDAAGQPLPYATVGVVGKAVGTVADEHGRFQLALPTAEVAATDTLRFALLGYASRRFVVAALPAAPLTVALAETTVALAGVLVRPARAADTLRLGHLYARTRLQTNFALSEQAGLNVGAEIGRVFQLPRGGAWLERFAFRASSNFDTVRLRLNVYQLRDGAPAGSLLTQPVYVLLINPKPGTAFARLTMVDLRGLNLFTKDDVVVTLEWVSHSRRGSRLAMPILMPAFATHLYRYGAANGWKRFVSMSTAMQLMAVRL